MLKTNSKQARENIRAWIMDNSDLYDWDGENETPVAYDNFADHAAHVWRMFCGEFMRDEQQRRYNMHYNKTWQGCFEDWLRGLPRAVCSDDFLLGADAAINCLGDILDETEAERSRYSEDEAERMMCYLIYREIVNAVNPTFF